VANVLANAGRAIITNRLGGGGTVPQYIGVGTGTGTSAVTDTTLFTEAYTASNNGTGATRVTGTETQQTTSVTNDTYRVTGTVTAAVSTAVTNAGVFDSNGLSGSTTTPPTGGNLFLKSDFSTVNLNTGDSLALTWNLQLS
jgi:hypothetical protein